MAEILESLSYKVKFSTEEITPLLEQKINSVMGEEYVIDFFITNAVGSDALEVSYYAFPKKIKDALSDSYLKMTFIHEGILYTYTKENAKRGVYKNDFAYRYVIKDNNFKNILLGQLEDYILIAKETTSINEALTYISASHKEKYHLYNGFFQYDASWDVLSETIENFANEKIAAMNASTNSYNNEPIKQIEVPYFPVQNMQKTKKFKYSRFVEKYIDKEQ